MEAIALGLVPSLCAACGRPCRRDAVTCAQCGRRLELAAPISGTGPPGVDRAWSSASYEGVARELVGALKFRRLLPVAELIADRIDWLAPRSLLGGELVPVPAAGLRLLARGFDPTAEIAAALAERAGLALNPCLKRHGGRRQVGKRREQRLSRPPVIAVGAGTPPRSAILVDDVLTTGATLSACARALRSAGTARIVAITFARRL